MRLSLQLLQGSSRQLSEVLLVNLAPKHIEDFETRWQAQLRQTQQEDQYWDWQLKKRLAVRYEDEYEGYAIEFEEETQGLLMLETQKHRSQLQRSQRLVYVEAIASAPWNRRSIQQPPRLLGVGSALLDFARQRSLALGYGGRVGLQSLPGAAGFYERKGMLEVPPEPDEYVDPEELSLSYFEYRAILP